MATYQKRGQKRSNKAQSNNLRNEESATAEVFETLDTTASKTESIVAKYQNHILIIVGTIVFLSLGYLSYQKFVNEPLEIEAISELNQAQYYFEMALNSSNSDSLYNRALNGGEGRYGFLDIIENWSLPPYILNIRAITKFILFFLQKFLIIFSHDIFAELYKSLLPK